MFCFAIANQKTGDIEHCFVDNGNGDIDFEKLISEGLLPIDIGELGPDQFYTIIPQEELIDILSKPEVERFSNNKKDIEKECLKMMDSIFDAVRIREEIKVFKKTEARGGFIKKIGETGKYLSSCRIEARPEKAKVNPIRGTIISDLSLYDEIVAEDERQLKIEEEEYRRKESMTIEDIKAEIKKELTKEMTEEIRKEIREEILLQVKHELCSYGLNLS